MKRKRKLGGSPLPLLALVSLCGFFAGCSHGGTVSPVCPQATVEEADSWVRLIELDELQQVQGSPRPYAPHMRHYSRLVGYCWGD